MSKPAKAKETCAHENRETTIGGGMRCKDCGAVVRGKAAPSPAEPIHVAGTRPDLLCCAPSPAERCATCGGNGYLFDVSALCIEVARLRVDNECMKMTELPVGWYATPTDPRAAEVKLGKAEEENERLRERLLYISRGWHSDTCGSVLSESKVYPCNCHIGIALEALK